VRKRRLPQLPLTAGALWAHEARLHQAPHSLPNHSALTVLWSGTQVAPSPCPCSFPQTCRPAPSPWPSCHRRLELPPPQELPVLQREQHC
jgi:hypothetical protein